MTEHNHQENTDVEVQGLNEEFDAGTRSLSDALRVSFIILKVIMIVLVVLFLVSGFRTVGPDEQALVLHFGTIRGAGEDRLLGPGLHWVFPYPVGEIIKIPVTKKVSLAVNSFWYYQRPEELLPEGLKKAVRIDPTLDPERDGYCLTRSEKQARQTAGSADSDYNIVHSKWQLIYQIYDPERFFRNVYVADVKPGQVYFDVITKSLKPFLKALVDDAIVTAMVDYTIDEALRSQDRIPKHVGKLLQQKLDAIESGIKVVAVQLTDTTWPRQIDGAFEAFITASQESQKAVSQARGEAGNILNEAAGPVADELLAAVENENIAQAELQQLWSQIAGKAGEEIAEARGYRTEVVENAKANAEYLQKILPEYRKHPKLVIHKIYLDAIEEVLDNADEKMIIQPTEGTRGKEIRIKINKDQSLKPK